MSATTNWNLTCRLGSPNLNDYLSANSRNKAGSSILLQTVTDMATVAGRYRLRMLISAWLTSSIRSDSRKLPTSLNDWPLASDWLFCGIISQCMQKGLGDFFSLTRLIHRRRLCSRFISLGFMLLLVPLSIRRLRLCKAHLSRAIALVCMVLLLVTVKSMASSSFLASPRFNASF